MTIIILCVLLVLCIAGLVGLWVDRQGRVDYKARWQEALHTLEQSQMLLDEIQDLSAEEIRERDGKILEQRERNFAILAENNRDRILDERMVRRDAVQRRLLGRWKEPVQ